MGRDDHNRKMHNANDPQLPLTPGNDTSTGRDDVELAEEVDELYNFEITPGLGVTGASRKDLREVKEE
jgi:hypothetical protein